METNKNDNIPVYSLGLGCQLYRIVKPFDNMDKANIEHFSYNHNCAKIPRCRFNKIGEPVLYTSNYPTIAERETLPEPNEFYLVKFRKTEDHKFTAFVAIDDNCSNDSSSDAKKAREIVKANSTIEELNYIEELRKILEKDYSNASEEEKYKDSSELASKILEVADCILTYSKTDDGKKNIPIGQESNRYLNVTFNQSATDKHLKIETIYHCKAKTNQTSLYYDILEIGIPDNDYKVIKWYDWDTEIDSIQVMEGIVIDKDSLLKKIRELGMRLMPNVNVSLCDTHIDIMQMPFLGKYKIQFSITLHKKSY